MKKNFTLLSTAVLLIAALQAEAQNTYYPGFDGTNTVKTYTAPKVTTPPAIDGNPSDVSWAAAPWRQAFAISPLDSNWPTGTAVSPEGAFDGATTDIDVKFKIVWDDGYYYILVRYKDDKIIYSDNHNGYRVGSVPTYVTATSTLPAAGAGDGSAYQAFRMDMIAYWLTPHTAGLESGTTAYNRANNGLMHNFFPGQLTNSVKPGESVLWAPKHNAGTTGTTTPQTHPGTVAGTFDAAEGAYYIEFRDDTWSTLFNSVRTKLTDQKLYGPTVPAVEGDKFLLQGEVNDADGTTNRRDYVNYFTHMATTSTNPSSNLSESLVVTLGGTLGVKSSELKNNLKFYVDGSSVLRFNESLDVEIYNMVGQKVIQSKNSSEINISSLPKGVYLVKDSEGKSGKLIKE